MIPVVLADDQALVRAGFRALLDAQDDIAVVGEAANGDEAVRLAREQRPDVVLMDIRMPGIDGLAATRRDRRRRAARRTSRSSSSPRSTSTSTCSRRSAPAPAASWSRTPSRPSCCAPCAPSSPATRCCRRA